MQNKITEEIVGVDGVQGAYPGFAGLALVRLVAFAIGIGLVAVIATILTRFLVPPEPSPWHQLVMLKNFLMPIAALAVYAKLVGWFERRPATEIALRGGGLRSAGFGLALGSGLIAAVVLILWSLGLATMTSGTGAQGLVISALVPFTTSVLEELLFRAVLFRLLEQMLGTALAALLSVALFGMAHLANPGSTPSTALFLSLDLGLLLTAAFAASRSLWLPIGLHIGWNFALSYLFGTLNSGMRAPYSMVQTTFAGPQILTGGSFGLEGSVITLVLSMIVTIGFVVVAWRGDGWQTIHFRW